MIRLKMKKYDMILTENLPKYQPYHQAKLISMNILLVRILPSKQQRIIEQAKFIYSLLRNAFEKQIKIIEEQEEKQIKAIQDQGQVKRIKTYIYDNEYTPLISKQKEIFNELVDERFEEITDLDKKKLIAMM